MDLHAVEAGLPREVHRMSEVVGDLQDFLLFQPAHEGGGVEVESGRGAHGGAAAGGAVRHVAAVSQLYGRPGAFGMYGVGEFPEFRNYFLAHPELGVEGQSGAGDRGVGDGGHSDSSACHGGMVVEQILRRAVVVSHVLEGGRAYHAVAQRDRPYLAGREYLGFNHELNI